MDPDDEIAYKIIELYIKELTHEREKPQIGLDTLTDAYFMTLARIKRKKQELGLVDQSQYLKHEEADFAKDLEGDDIESVLFKDQEKTKFDF